MDYAKKKFEDLPDVDRNIIEDLPWAKEMWTNLEKVLSKSFLYWCQMVMKMGGNEQVLKNWIKTFKELHEEVCCELVFDMEGLQGRVIESIEEMLKNIQDLCNTLQIEMPVLGDEQRSLCEEQNHLEKQIDEYKKLIELRRSEINKLRQKQLDLCNNLGKEPKIIRDSPLPSFDEIEEFKKHIDGLEHEKFLRLEKFLSMKENIVEIMSELKLVPSSQFEENVLSSDDSEFLVTDNNMKQLSQFQKNLIKQQKNTKEEIALLRSKVDDFWNLLDVDLKDREEFRQKYSGNSIQVLEALRIEVKRCEDVKKANIKVFIDKLRVELKQYWDKCHCSQSSKAEFRFFYSDCYNEDLLELHEVELTKWKKYYNENKELLTLLEKHQKLWNKMVELEENAAGPNRYNNRGGQLLKEEKERNKLAKQIPQVEETIRALADKYQQHHNVIFTTFGESVHDYITNLHEDRENAKKQKLSARKIQREQTVLTPARSALNLFPSTSQHTLRSATPLSTVKRKIATPMTDDKKKLKLAVSEKKSKKITNTPSVPIIKLTTASGRSKRLSHERKKRLNKIIRRSIQKKGVTTISQDSTTTDYGDFQNELSNRSDCRSTIIPLEITLPETPRSVTTKSRITPKLQSATKILSTPKIASKTPIKVTPRTPDTEIKLSRAKTNLKLIF